MKIGIDFGGVIVKASEGEPFDCNDGLNIEQDGAIEAISLLNRSHEVFIISKASPRVQSFTREWLSIVGFYQKVKFRPENLFFCEKRNEKLGICLDLNIDCFIDDSNDVVNLLSEKIDNVIHFTKKSKNLNVRALSNWQEIVNEIVS